MAATTKMDANNREDILPHNGATKNLSLKGEGRSRSPASSAAPNCDSNDGGRPVESRRGGEGGGAHKKGRRRPRAKGSPPPRKGGGPASRGGGDDEDGGDDGATAFAPVPAGPPVTLKGAQEKGALDREMSRGNGGHEEDGRQQQGGHPPAQRREEEPLHERGGPPSESSLLGGAQLWQRRWRTPGGIQARWRRRRRP